ncbi:Origin recognition complex subunit 3 [Zancudomyces culisetae]|uniref:Origin recognition complex subunit 3 n=1 Tax=Zancudomyces culisetae TaxID=1213189 RepID=A0A1R1PYY2_ZANCU|nr:Origin recognition complex subunit 3 [Zancudomyces culisetae]|eukprot:OMH86166.1 Origin recognition complex subunit 3 [Zancudomyces culisetae]
MASLSSPTMAYQIKTVDELKFTPSHIEMVLMQKSVIRYVGNKYSDDKELLKKALNDQVHFTRVILVDMLTIVELYQRRYKVGIKLVEAIQSVLPKNAKNQAFSARIIHYNTVGEGFESSQVFAQLVSGLKRLSSSQILELLHKILSILEREEELYQHHKLKLAGIRKPDGLCYDPKQLCGQPIAKITECISAFKSNTSSPAETKSASVYTRRQITENPYLLALSSNDVQNENALRLANVSIPNILSSFLLHYSNVPLHEIFYYDNSNLLSQSFNPQIRHYIQTALSTPEFYLGSPEDSQAKFDISVLYNLHLETGRFINLYDWFMSYNYVISRGGPIDSGLLVRFQTAVNSLFFMGLIKPTNVKPDHIERLTFGSF